MDEACGVDFDLRGAGLSVAAPRQSWIDPFMRPLGGFVVETPTPDPFRVVVREDDAPSVPPGMPLTWEGDFLEKRAGRIYETESDQIIEVVGHGYVAIGHRERSAEAIMKPGSENAMSFTPVISLLESALRAAGKHLLHAACLQVPDGSGALVICAPSGFGKTTTSLALARGGFGLVTDDSSVIEPRGEGLQVWGLPRRLKVHRRTAAMMPWLGEFPNTWNDEDEQPVTLDRLRPLVSIADPVARPLKAVVLLGERSDGEHRIAQLSKPEALVRISHDNISNSRTGVKPWSRRNFEVYGEMLRAAPVLQLNAGTGLETLPERLGAALSRLD